MDAMDGTLGDTRMRFEIFHDETDEFSWRLVDRDGHALAECPLGYPTRKACVAAIESVRASGRAYMLDLASESERLCPREARPRTH
jgi:uncharacterized protein YegP (UPF0339 family)